MKDFHERVDTVKIVLPVKKVRDSGIHSKTPFARSCLVLMLVPLTPGIQGPILASVEDRVSTYVAGALRFPFFKQT